ncbi:MAG TPA: signal peptidase II [Zeimonas sp.]|jgi:signal peptidase II|nr:signal peptidase II [Zeimonas sp.]
MARSRNAAIGRWLWIAAAVIALDQATKYAIEHAFARGERVAVVPGFFDLTLVYNRGAAFSFLAQADGWQRWFFIGVGATATVFIVWLLTRHASQRLFAFSLALILGGAIGNVVDRVFRGHVVDFVLLYWQRFHWPAFNVADSAITVGAVLLVVDELRRVRRSR